MVWHSVPLTVQQLFPRRIWKGESKGNQVYLTFDDGPVPGVTDYVLDELAKRGQKATFFMVGDNVRKNPQLAKEVLQEGHQLGNHTFHHLNGWKTSKAKYQENIEAFDQITMEELSWRTDLFRPPYGLLTNSQAKAILPSKKIIMWNVLSGDYDLSLKSSEILKRCMGYTKAGSIVVFHDQQKTKEVMRTILPQYLDFLHERSYETSLL
jgi:peptidoglycan-N-acetylglucosamine deacetylase